MAFAFDPNATNAALNKLGSEYQLPGAADAAGGTGVMASAAPAVSVSTAPAQAAPAIPPPPATNDPGAPATTEPGGGMDVSGALSKVQGAASGIADIKGEKENEAFKKVGSLVGAVLSAYTGNAMGVASGIKGMSGK